MTQIEKFFCLHSAEFLESLRKRLADKIPDSCSEKLKQIAIGLEELGSKK